MNALKVQLKSMLPTLKQFKSMVGISILLIVIFSSILIYKANETELPRDAEYSQIYDTEDENNEN